MVNEVLDYSPAVEMLRVPLIVRINPIFNILAEIKLLCSQPCVNMAAGNVVDVCCRDPNYK